MRLWPTSWHPETGVCSIRGHVTPAAGARVVTPDDAALGAELADGRRLARCLRCDSWVEHAPPEGADADFERLPPLAALDKPLRGAPLHEAIVTRLIALNKGLHAFVFTLASIALVVLQTNLGRLHGFAQRVLNGVSGPIGETGQGASRSWLGRQLVRLLDLRAGTLKIFLVIALTYAVVEWTEAVGLWRQRRWAEYLTVLATAGFLPLEIHELLKRVTVLRLLALVVNVALIVWLVRTKRLFGVRGGAHAVNDEIDWPAVLAAPTPAARWRPRVAPGPVAAEAERAGAADETEPIDVPRP